MKGLSQACVMCAVVGFVMPATGQEEEEKPGSKLVGVVGGSLEDDYPEVGAILQEDEMLCTGTLIRSNVVLTAAHCFEKGVKARDLSFFIGNDLAKRDEGELIQAVSYRIHPEYDPKEVTADIALIILKHDAESTDPIDYRRKKMNPKKFKGRKILFVGFGVTSVLGSGAGRKRSVTIPIDQFEGGTFSYTDFFDKNTCSGDSGGPALDLDSGVPVVIGVTSHGDILCALSGVSARTDAHKAFIKKTLKDARSGRVKADPNEKAASANDDDDPPYDEDEECCGCTIGTPHAATGIWFGVLVCLMLGAVGVWRRAGLIGWATPEALIRRYKNLLQ